MRSSSDSLDSLHVLIVDDDPALLRSMGDVLRLKGFHPRSAQSGKQAVELAREEPPSVALVDLRLPDMDGLDLIAALQAEHAATQVVVLTGNASVSSAVAAVRVQIFDYLLKPVAPQQLVDTIERAGERWRRRHAEEALTASERRFRSLIEHAVDPITIVDAAGVIRYASPAHQAALGVTPSALVGRPLAELVHEEDAAAFQEAWAALVAQPALTRALTVRLRHENGSWHTLQGTAKNLLADATIEGIVFNVRDITERLSLEAQLRHAQKLEAIGQLAGGISHDLNNILTAITGFTQFAQRKLTDDHAAREDLEQVELATERAATLTRQLLAFSRRQVLQPAPLDLSAVVRGMEGMLRRLIGPHITIQLRLATLSGSTMADPTQIEQVILNLAINARDAMPDGGTLIIETRDVELDEDYARQHAGATPGPHVTLVISDTGTGMDADTLARIFEPFFTTKAAGRGTGLGLSTVYGIVQQSGGNIWVYSEPGQGTTFKIHLPRTARHAEAEAAPARPERQTPAARASKRILVVEDDEAVRRAAVRTLADAGYAVHPVGSAGEGMAALEEADGAFDLVLTDIVMPGGLGHDFGRHLRERWPRVGILFMSGYSSAALEGQHRLVEGSAFIEKPFTPSRLVDAVEGVLGRIGS